MAKLADALDLGSSPKGWEFDSSHPHQSLLLITRFITPFILIGKFIFSISIYIFFIDIAFWIVVLYLGFNRCISDCIDNRDIWKVG